MKRNFIKLLILCICAAFTMPLQAGKGPSFDCKKASTVQEKMICRNYTLTRLDRDLGKLYRHLKLRGVPVKQVQRAWIKSRNKLTTKQELRKSYQEQLEVLKRLAYKQRDLYVYNIDYRHLPTKIYVAKNGRRFFVNTGNLREIKDYGLTALSQNMLVDSGRNNEAAAWFEAHGLKSPQYDYLKEVDFRNIDFAQLPYLGCTISLESYPESKAREEFCKNFRKRRVITVFAEEYQISLDGKEPVQTLAANCKFKGRYFKGKLENKGGTLDCNSKQGTQTTLYIGMLIFRDFNHDGYMDVFIAVGTPYGDSISKIRLAEYQFMFLTKTDPNQKQLTRLFMEDFPYMQNLK